MGMLRARASALVTVAVVVALAGCSGDDGTDVPAFTGSPSPSASTDGPPDGSPDGSSESTDAGTSSGDDGGVPVPEAVAVLGDVAATPEQQPVVDAWFTYWQVLTSSARAVEVDDQALGEVARGEARARVERYVDELRSAGNRLGGAEFVLNVDAVTADATSATVTGCAQDRSFDVSAVDGSPQQGPGGQIGLRGTLVQEGDVWVVSDVQNDPSLC